MPRITYTDWEGIRAFGNKLRELRKEKGVSQEELCRRANLQLSQVGRIERGEINTSISFVYLFAKALEVEPKTFFE